MLKRTSIILLLTLLFCNTWAQGWRKGEMEVRVMMDHTADVQKIRQLGLNYEPAATDGSTVRMYLVPEELKLLQKSQLRYQVTIADLNKHYEHFWDNPNDSIRADHRKRRAVAGDHELIAFHR